MFDLSIFFSVVLKCGLIWENVRLSMLCLFIFVVVQKIVGLDYLFLLLCWVCICLIVLYSVMLMLIGGLQRLRNLFYVGGYFRCLVFIRLWCMLVNFRLFVWILLVYIDFMFLILVFLLFLRCLLCYELSSLLLNMLCSCLKSQFMGLVDLLEVCVDGGEVVVM